MAFAYCGLHAQQLSYHAHMLAPGDTWTAAVILCIFQVPAATSRLHRLPLIAFVGVLLVLLSMHAAPGLMQLRHAAAPPAVPVTFTVISTTAFEPAAPSAAYIPQLPTTALQPVWSAGGGLHSTAARLRSATVAAAAASILLGMLLLQAPRRAASSSRHRRRLRLSILVSAVTLLLLRPAAAAATTCSAVTPVCTKAAAAPPSAAPAAAVAKPVTATQGSNNRAPSLSVQQALAPKQAPAPAPAVMLRSPAPAPAPVPAPAPAPAAPSASYADTLLAAMGARGLLSAQRQAAVSEVPQRVLPTAEVPSLSPEMQAQLLNQLLRVLMAPPANASRPNPPPQEPLPPPSPSAPVVVGPLPPAPLPADGMLYLSNGRLRLGVDATRGGALSFLAASGLPAPLDGTNLINTWDSGRLVQQSYYGCADASCWSGNAWRWNPVQGGSWQNRPPKLLSFQATSDSITTTSIPRNWGGQQLLSDVLLTSQVTLLDNLIKMKTTMRFNGSAMHPPRHQELPAVFLSRRLGVLALYTGDAPWTNLPVSFVLPGQTGEYFKPSERWAAFVDPASGFGVGVYNPWATELVAYRIGPDDSKAASDCSYLAPLVTAAIQPGSELSYEVFLAVGRVDELRSAFGVLAAAGQPSAPLQRRMSLAVAEPPSSLLNDGLVAEPNGLAAAAQQPPMQLQKHGI